MALSRTLSSLFSKKFSNSDTALYLRVGLGIVFIIGGYNKLSQPEMLILLET